MTIPGARRETQSLWWEEQGYVWDQDRAALSWDRPGGSKWLDPESCLMKMRRRARTEAGRRHIGADTGAALNLSWGWAQVRVGWKADLSERWSQSQQVTNYKYNNIQQHSEECIIAGPLVIRKSEGLALGLRIRVRPHALHKPRKH